MLMRRIHLVTSLAGVVAALLIGGCSDTVDSGSLVDLGNGDVKTPESVSRLVAPEARTNSLATVLAQYRLDAMGTASASYPFAADNVLYTAAMRHAVYLNTLNSRDHATGTVDPGDAGTITPSTSWSTFGSEPVSGGTAWPWLYTHTTLANRVQAVVGGTTLLKANGNGNYDLAEFYVFNGDVPTSDGVTTTLRSFPEGRGTPADTLWYDRRGRQHLMRAGLRYVGYGRKDDADASGKSVTPPYPILGGRFIGTWVLASTTPSAGVLGWWPNNANQAVSPYGLDTDMGGPTQYSGPPMHLTLPVAEPFLKENGVRVDLTRVDTYQGTPVAPAYPYSQASWRMLRVFSNVSGLTVVNAVDSAGGYTVQGDTAPVVSSVAMVSSTYLGDVVANEVATHSAYRIVLSTAANLGTAASPVIRVGDEIAIAVSATTSPAPTSASVGTYRYTITAINYDTRSVEVEIPIFTTGHRPFEALPNTTSTEIIRYGHINNVRISIYGSSSNSGTSGVVAEVDSVMSLKDGELVIVPTAPLEPDAWYRLQVQGTTFSADSGLKTVYFKTRSRNW